MNLVVNVHLVELELEKCYRNYWKKLQLEKAQMEDLEKLEELAEMIKRASVCGLGQTAPNPVLSTLKYFRDEYIAHIIDKKCPAGECKSIITV